MLVGPGTLLAPTGPGPLNGLQFVVKQVFDVAGQVTGAGNLVLAAESLPAQRSSPAVDLLLAAGATCIGTSHTDQFAFSLSGVDSQTGQPRNPVDPSRLPGGSSSGSAVAVASGLVLFECPPPIAGWLECAHPMGWSRRPACSPWRPASTRSAG